MPEFIAVQCFKCNQYQVAQKRKDSNFFCKLCNAKQSVRKVLAHSDRAADVRKFVQQLNLTRGRAEEKFDEQQNADNPSDEESDENGSCVSSAETPGIRTARVPLSQSRWQPYSTVIAKRNRTPDRCEVDDSDAEDDIVTALPDIESKVRRRKRKKQSKQRNGTRKNSHQSLQIGAPLSRNTSPKNNESAPNKNQARYQWGTDPWRENRPTTSNFSHEVSVPPGRRLYEWGRSVPRTSQSQRSTNSQFRATQNRWGALPSQRPKTPQGNVGASRELETAPESDGLLTTLGADEVVQDEVLY